MIGRSGGSPDARAQLVVRIATERGINFEPVPATVAHVLPQLADAVAEMVRGLSKPHELRWVAAALAALSHRTDQAALASSTSPDHR